MLLRERFGALDYQSREYLFDITEYYFAELGQPLFRKFVSFEKMIDPASLVQIKLFTNDIEEKLADEGKRSVNLDPGYMDFHKLVLASAKYNSQKIYLDKGIYADPTIFYEKGRFYPVPTAFPDFKIGIYENDFLHIRFLYKNQIKNIT